MGMIVLGALAGLGLQRVAGRAEGGGLGVSLSLRTGMFMLLLFFGLLLLLPLAAGHSPSSSLQVFDGFYRSGALVFGGGHVVLPLLQAEVVSPGWIGADELDSWRKKCRAGGLRTGGRSSEIDRLRLRHLRQAE